MKVKVMMNQYIKYPNPNSISYQIESNQETKLHIYCFLKFRDNKTILCGCNNGIFCFYDMNTEQYKITKKNHHRGINDILLIDDNTFLSCSADKTIKVWKY